MRLVKPADVKPSLHLFDDSVIDLRKKAGRKYSELHTIRCGVACKLCNWRGYRKLGFLLDFPGGSFDAVKVTSMIKGVPSFKGCPSCYDSNPHGDSPIVFTHIPQRQYKARL